MKKIIFTIAEDEIRNIAEEMKKAHHNRLRARLAKNNLPSKFPIFFSDFPDRLEDNSW